MANDRPNISAEEIRRIRRLLGETQALFARRLSVDQVTVARWETGMRKCTGLHAVTIAALDPQSGHSGPASTEQELVTGVQEILDRIASKTGTSKTAVMMKAIALMETIRADERTEPGSSADYQPREAKKL